MSFWWDHSVLYVDGIISFSVFICICCCLFVLGLFFLVQGWKFTVRILDFEMCFWQNAYSASTRWLFCLSFVCMLLLNFCHIFLYNDSEVVGHLEVFELLSTLQSGIHTGVPTIVSAAPWIHSGVLTIGCQCCPLDPHRGANSWQCCLVDPQRGANSWWSVLPPGPTKGCQLLRVSAAPWIHKGVPTLEGQCCPLDPQRGANSWGSVLPPEPTKGC